MTEVEPGMSIDDWHSGLTHAPESSFREFVLGEATDDNATRMVYVRLEAGQSGPRHAHGGWTFNVVLEGSCEMGGLKLAPGQVLTCAPDVQYGPLTPGPEGVTLLEIFDTRLATAPVWQDTAAPEAMAYQKWLTDHFGSLG